MVTAKTASIANHVEQREGNLAGVDNVYLVIKARVKVMHGTLNIQ